MKPFDEDFFVLIPTGITETGEIVYKKCRSPKVMRYGSPWGKSPEDKHYAEIPKKNEGLVTMQKYEP